MPRNLEFFYRERAVGTLFRRPTASGQYDFEAYRSQGHFDFATAIKSGESPRCHLRITEKGQTVDINFTVRAVQVLINHQRMTIELDHSNPE